MVTAVGGDIGGNIINILSEQKDIKYNIIGTDINATIFNSNKLNSFYQVDKVNTFNYRKKILEILKIHNIHIIVPVSELEILWFNLNRDLFKKYKLIINNTNIITYFLNKLETSKKLKNINIKTPSTYILSQYNNQINFPIIIKSITSTISKNIYKIHSEVELNYIKSILDQNNYIVQEYIGTIEDEYTTTVYQSNNILKTISFKRKLTGGMTSFANIVNEDVLNSNAINIAKAFNLNGSINIQSRKSGKDFYVFEINPRFSSTIYIRDYFGFQDLIWSIKDILSLDVSKNNINICKKGSAILGYRYDFSNK